MIIVDPVVLGDVPFTRASPKWVYDRTGTLVQVPANTLGVTYDPADLSKAPWALLEPESKNLALNSDRLELWNWNGVSVVTNAEIAPNGQVVAEKLVEVAAAAPHYVYQTRSATNETVTFSAYVKAAGRSWIYLNLSNFVNASCGAHFNLATGRIVSVDAGNADYSDPSAKIEYCGRGWFRCSFTVTKGSVNSNNHLQINFGRTRSATAADLTYAGDGASGIYLWGVQLELGPMATSYIQTLGTSVTRAADVVGAGAGLVYSNVPMVEPPYNVATTYAKDAAVYDPATKLVYWSMVAGNVGKALSDPAFWNKRTAINRWAMFDDRNSTQTSNPEEIVSVFSAQAITQGLFAGAMDASEVRVSMTHPTRGLVFSETKSLVLPRSGSSFFGWCFNRLRLRTWFLTLKLPVFANALVTVTIKKPGGVPKCGMCLLGPTIDVGLSLMGLSTELKDYSTTTFFTDGSSSTVERGFSKKMSVDIVVERDRVETIEDDLIKRRQKTLVFLGSTMRGDTMLVGRFSSLRKVIDSYPRSKMALQIDGVLSQ
jgi:hypothetical protein